MVTESTFPECTVHIYVNICDSVRSFWVDTGYIIIAVGSSVIKRWTYEIFTNRLNPATFCGSPKSEPGNPNATRARRGLFVFKEFLFELLT